MQSQPMHVHAGFPSWQAANHSWLTFQGSLSRLVTRQITIQRGKVSNLPSTKVHEYQVETPRTPHWNKLPSPIPIPIPIPFLIPFPSPVQSKLQNST